MPRLKKIVIQNFRNIDLQEICFSKKVNCISGGNGEGKTNLLDAVWYLSMAKSYFSSSEQFNFKHGTFSFGIGGQYSMDNGADSGFSVKVSKEGGSSIEKKFRRDDKPYGRISEHIGTLPIVMVSPSDGLMISESGEGRRKFANSVLSQMSSSYLSDIQIYNRYLLQRNKLLKAGSADECIMDTLEDGLGKYGRLIFEARSRLTEEICPAVIKYYESISGGKESIGIDYVSCFQKEDLSGILKRNRTLDHMLKYTSSGIQRDDFIFTMDGHPIRYSGSQGQQKSFLVALKFAQYDFMTSHYGTPPILLLDDLFDKLDPSRVSNLLAMVSSNEFGQIFITDSDRSRIRSIMDKITDDKAYYVAEGGAYTKEYE